MNRVIHVATQLKSWLRQYPHTPEALGLSMIMVIGGILIVGLSGSPSRGVQSVKATTTSMSTADTPAKADAEKNAPPESSNQQPDDTTNRATNSPQQKPGQPVAATPPSKSRRLLVSPAAITMRAGESKPITVQSDDGTPVTMPMFANGSPHFHTNFPAAPFKAAWSGSVMSMTQTPAGTYNLQLSGQVNRNDVYTGSITVTILASPYVTVSATPAIYDAASDSLRLNVKLNRHNGFDEVVIILYGGYASAPGPINMECGWQLLGNDNYAVECGHTYGPRPTGGQLTIQISTARNSSGAYVPFTLPSR